MFMPIHDGRIAIKGAVPLEVTDKYIRPWRLDFERKALFYPDMMVLRASNAAGVRLEFSTNSDLIGLRYQEIDTSFHNPDRDTLSVDLEIDTSDILPALFSHGSTGVVWNGLAGGLKNIRIWLHQFSTFALTGIDLDDGAEIAGVTRECKKWIAYGSSITHSRDGLGPSQTWPAIVSRTLDLDLTCLGFGGQCHLDPIYAKLIRDLPADMISLKLGINTHGRSLSPRTYRPAIIGFVDRIREKHSETPLFLCSPIFGGPRETESVHDDGYTLQFMRSEMKRVVEIYRSMGDGNLHYVDGLKLFGPEYADYLPDNTHPDGRGQPIMAENFIKAVKPAISQ